MGLCVCKVGGLAMPLCVVVHLQYENSGNVHVVLCVCLYKYKYSIKGLRCLYMYSVGAY